MKPPNVVKMVGLYNDYTKMVYFKMSIMSYSKWQYILSNFLQKRTPPSPTSHTTTKAARRKEEANKTFDWFKSQRTVRETLAQFSSCVVSLAKKKKTLLDKGTSPSHGDLPAERHHRRHHILCYLRCQWCLRWRWIRGCPKQRWLHSLLLMCMPNP